MTYTSFPYLLLCTGLVPVYYLFPQKLRYLVLLAGSALFYLFTMGRRAQLLLFFLTIALSYGAGLLIESTRDKTRKKCILALSIVLCLIPLLLPKLDQITSPPGNSRFDWVIPLGLSFYTLQIISYLIDIYRGKITAQRHFLKYALFISFFPQLLQGPIPRFQALWPSLTEGNAYRHENLTKGAMLILWGFFLKYMIADRAGTAVDTLFSHAAMYQGTYVLIAGTLYSIQLYADFLSATTIAQGVGALYGVSLSDNFRHPYFAVSIQDFWRRWHISLSTWLRDYVYIPLGGSRKGTLRRYIHVLITFLVSGLWHGGGIHFLAWGLLHGLYQTAGALLMPLRKKFCRLIRLQEASFSCRFYRTILTSFLVMLGWILFRAETLTKGLSMIVSMITVRNPWIFFDGSLSSIGPSQTDWFLLILSVLVLLLVSFLQERMCIRDWVLEQHILFRWMLYIAVFLVIWIFGSYGYGFSPQAFIYGNF